MCRRRRKFWHPILGPSLLFGGAQRRRKFWHPILGPVCVSAARSAAEIFGIQFWAQFGFRRRAAAPKFLASNFGHSFLARFLNILRFRTKPNFLSEILGAQFLSSEILKAHFLKKTVSYMREPTVCLPTSDTVPIRSWTWTLRRPGIRHRHTIPYQVLFPKKKIIVWGILLGGRFLSSHLGVK